MGSVASSGQPGQAQAAPADPLGKRLGVALVLLEKKQPPHGVAKTKIFSFIFPTCRLVKSEKICHVSLWWGSSNATPPRHCVCFSPTFLTLAEAYS